MKDNDTDDSLVIEPSYINKLVSAFDAYTAWRERLRHHTSLYSDTQPELGGSVTSDLQELFGQVTDAIKKQEYGRLRDIIYNDCSLVYEGTLVSLDIGETLYTGIFENPDNAGLLQQWREQYASYTIDGEFEAYLNKLQNLSLEEKKQICSKIISPEGLPAFSPDRLVDDMRLFWQAGLDKEKPQNDDDKDYMLTTLFNAISNSVPEGHPIKYYRSNMTSLIDLVTEKCAESVKFADSKNQIDCNQLHYGIFSNSYNFLSRKPKACLTNNERCKMYSENYMKNIEFAWHNTCYENFPEQLKEAVLKVIHDGVDKALSELDVSAYGKYSNTLSRSTTRQ